MAYQECAAFNPNEQCFAICGADGKIKIWDTSTGILKHEYTPNLHLSSPCSCIHWISLISPQITPQTKKRRTLDSELNALAIGLGSGQLLIFSLSTGTIVSILGTVETVGNAITALTYEPENGEIITSTQDNKIFTWKIGSKNVKYISNWKCAAPQTITSLLVTNKGEWLLCGHYSISLWERSSMELLKTFAGHASDISQMVLLKSVGPDDTSYFISSAKGDRYLSVWSLKEKSRSKSATVSLKLEDAPKYTSVHIQGNNEPVSVVSVTKDGHLHLFQHHFNGKISKPIRPKLTIQIRNENKVTATRIPLIAGKICNLNLESLMLAYGSMYVVTFEKIDLNTHERELTLYRKIDTKPQPITEESITKVKKPEVKNAEYLQSVSYDKSKSSVGRKRGHLDLDLDSSTSVLGMEGRIDNLTIEDNIKNETPKGAQNSLNELLIQGLKSNDRRILQYVFSKNDENLINSTISRLQMQFVVPLLTELVSLTERNAHLGLIAFKWIRALFDNHLSYLSAVSHETTGLYERLRHVRDKWASIGSVSRVAVNGRAFIRHINEQRNQEDNGLEPSKIPALVYYQDEDDEHVLESESEDEDRMNIPESEDEDRMNIPESEDEDRMNIPESEDKDRMNIPESDDEEQVMKTINDDKVEENGVEKMDEEDTEEMQSDDDDILLKK